MAGRGEEGQRVGEQGLLLFEVVGVEKRRGEVVDDVGDAVCDDVAEDDAGDVILRFRDEEACGSEC